MSRYAKTIIAVLVAGLTALQVAITDSTVSGQEWVVIALAAVGAVGVYAWPNTPPAGQPADPTISERGYTVVELLIIVVIVIIVAVFLFELLERV